MLNLSSAVTLAKDSGWHNFIFNPSSTDNKYFQYNSSTGLITCLKNGVVLVNMNISDTPSMASTNLAYAIYTSNGTESRFGFRPPVANLQRCISHSRLFRVNTNLTISLRYVLWATTATVTINSGADTCCSLVYLMEQ